MKIKVKQDFRDRSADLALRKKGEVLDVSEQRAKELIAKSFFVHRWDGENVCQRTRIFIYVQIH